MSQFIFSILLLMVNVVSKISLAGQDNGYGLYPNQLGIQRYAMSSFIYN